MHRPNTLRYFTAAALIAAIGIGAPGAAMAATQAALPDSAAATARGIVTVQRGFNRGCYNALPLTVYVDGKPASPIAVGQTLVLRILPGHYRVGVAIGSGHSDAGTANGMPLTVVRGGSTALFANLGPGGPTIGALAH